MPGKRKAASSTKAKCTASCCLEAPVAGGSSPNDVHHINKTKRRGITNNYPSIPEVQPEVTASSSDDSDDSNVASLNNVNLPGKEDRGVGRQKHRPRQTLLAKTGPFLQPGTDIV
jgi:hypothetical protein